MSCLSLFSQKAPLVAALGGLVALSLGGCSGDGNPTSAPPPQVVYVEPSCDGIILKPTTYELVGQVTAGDLGGITAFFEISGPPGTISAPATIDESGLATATYTFDTQGSYQISFVADDGRSPQSTEATSCAVANQSPVGTIVSPLNASSYNQEEEITLLGTVSDPDDDLTTLTVTWSSARDGVIAEGNPDASGSISLTASGLSVFNHLLTMRVEDPYGGVDEAQVTVEISECKDQDEDGFTACSQDCDDRNPDVYPGAVEICDGLDNDCNELIDELGDGDGDTYDACDDCDDANPLINPGATEICDERDNDCDGGSDEGFDQDGDGVAVCAGDCDDNNPNAFPGRIEICDGVDQDCDSLIDEGLASIYYQDSDRDSYGNPDAPLELCSPTAPPGYTDNSEDCDDTNNTVFPGAPEGCDGLDNDCDGSFDEGQILSTFFMDADGDGFGDGSTTVEACVRPQSASDNGDDCDDLSATVYPGASEVCDGFDQDCDGVADNGVQTTYYYDPDGDGYGDDSTFTQACQAPDGYVSQGGDCGPTDPLTSPDAAESCDGADNDCDGTTDEDVAVTYYGDDDGDGYGENSDTVAGCTTQNGYVAQGGDCDDDNPDINPGAAEVCDGVDQNCDGTSDEGTRTTFYEDSDGDGFGADSETAQACSLPDGYSPVAGDCNDTKADSFPGAEELCDAVDNDCNGEVDNGLLTRPYYVDSDGDGYGDESDVFEACVAPEGYVEQGGDCDDRYVVVYPGADERCNGNDNDCDGTIDEGVKNTYYRDVDGDGYGDADVERFACNLCNGCSENPDDCDDTRDDIYPGAPEKFDGEDNDCDGELEREMNLVAAASNFGGSTANSLTGAGLGTVGDIDGDGLNELAFGAPQWNGLRGQVYVMYGSTAGWESGAASLRADTIFSGSEPDSQAGWAISGGDIDNDGRSDLFIGIPDFDSLNGQLSSGGMMSLYYGGSRFIGGDLMELADNFVQGYFPSVQVGFSLDGQGDITCDGIDDVLIGSPWPWATQNPPFGGVVFVLPGKNSRYTGAGGIGGGSLIQIYGGSNQILGIDVAHVGDVDQSGCGDFVGVGFGKAGMGPSSYVNGGISYLMAGGDSSVMPTSTILNAEELDISTYEGSEPTDLLGRYTDGAGDVNGDLQPDFIAGRADGNPGDPLALLYYGGDLLPNSGLGESVSNVAFVSNSGLTCPCVGAGLGDVNNDGLDDIAIGMPNAPGGGQIYILFGKDGGFGRTTTIETAADVIISAEATGDKAGAAIAGLGDINGDGVDDFAISAPSATGEVDNAGKVYVFLGY